ncbi:hypothetical protein V6N11_077951 [Hibiscus sabdariffa]|uniref:Uncharacterized protein n=1 Tax=Hibiscus sabdariffa TaxID=183260 RepID=A0ABR2TEN9_9ROSI
MVGPTGPFSQCSQGVVRVVVPTGVVRWSDRKSVGQKFGHSGVGTRVLDLAVNALMFSSIDVNLAARRLQQLLSLLKIGLPPLPQPTIPTMLKSGSLPRLPSIPNLSSAPKVTLSSFPLIPTISTTIPSIHFLFLPPSTTSS